jgi:hypothetical protein
VAIDTNHPNEEERHLVLRMLARERLSIDEAKVGRTCFLSHLGAQPSLTPAAWIGHRDLLYALALSNLAPAQRTSLARAVLVDYGNEFGVGRLLLRALPSGLPLGGSSLVLRPRQTGPTCLYTWGLSPEAQPERCDWLLLKAQPQWALDSGPPSLKASGLETLVALGGEVVVLVSTTTAAIQVAQACPEISFAAHPRFAPHIGNTAPDAPVLLWPHDALDGAGLRRREVVAAVMVEGTERLRQDVEHWLDRRGGSRAVEVVDVACPDRMDRTKLLSFWRACGSPSLLLRGEPTWVGEGAAWLREQGAAVEAIGEATQLELLC